MEFSDQEMGRLKKLAAREQAGEKRRVDWPAATPTPKEVLEFFGDNVCPETGMPYHPDRVAPATMSADKGDNDWLLDQPARAVQPIREPMLEAERARQEAHYRSLWEAWAALPAMRKTQLAADNRYNKPEYPGTLFVVQLVPRDGAVETDQPPIVIKGITPADAQAHYLALCGITSFSQDQHLMICTPYKEAAA
jgi:hypothetical protein